MSYLQEFELLIANQQFHRFLKLWEEYCMGDQIDAKELLAILEKIKNSPFAKPFGEISETLLTIWEQIKDKELADAVLRQIFDLQTTNSPRLLELALQFLQERYGSDPKFNEKLRLIGLTGKRSFQGALRNFELLRHMKKGSFVFHTGGWGVGQVMDISFLREHASVEFEGITAPKDISFDNAFNNLVALPNEHFLARRFGNPDALEKEAKQDPLSLIHLLLKDLGPKSAAEIKEELADLVIPESDWQKWWQAARSKIKKDTKIGLPERSIDSFYLRDEELSHESSFIKKLKPSLPTSEVLSLIYSSTRDFPIILKNSECKDKIQKILLQHMEQPVEEEAISPERESALKLQTLLLLDEIFSGEYEAQLQQSLHSSESIYSILENVEIIALKKRLLSLIRQKEGWISIFLTLLFSIDQNQLRDYLLKELLAHKDSRELTIRKLEELPMRATLHPEALFWYFQKILEEPELPLSDNDYQLQFLESFFILLHYLEQIDQQRDLVRKMYQFLVAKRYSVFRQVIKSASLDYLKEILLLTSKCHSLSKQDLRILHSLAEVVQPAIGKGQWERERHSKEEILWTTQAGYQKLQERIHQVGSIETIDNAHEIEAARALGDLRENSEYKFALERRARLQSELKSLMQQLNNARLLTAQDISTDEVSVGTIVNLKDGADNKVTYTLLGAWDADPEQNILSLQSKLAQSLLGTKKGDKVEIQGQEYTVENIQSYLA